MLPYHLVSKNLNLDDENYFWLTEEKFTMKKLTTLVFQLIFPTVVFFIPLRIRHQDSWLQIGRPLLIVGQSDVANQLEPRRNFHRIKLTPLDQPIDEIAKTTASKLGILFCSESCFSF